MLALWWWIDRWRKSTAFTDMTIEEQGAYRNLLDEATLRDGLLPNDERVLEKACGDPRVWKRVRVAVLGRFIVTPEGLRNDTLDEVLHQSRRRAKKQADWRARSGNGAGNEVGNASGNDDGNYPGSPDPDHLHKEHKERTAPPAPRKPKSSDWKRAIAIGHAVMEQYPDSQDWTPEFKARCAAQGINYGQPGGETQRPLYARALDYVERQRAKRTPRTH